MARKPVTELKEKKILKNELNKEMFIFLLVKKVEIKTAKNGSEYLDIVASNKDNIIDFKKFELTDEERSVRPGEIIKIRCEIQLYNGAPQLKVFQFRKASAEEVSIEELIPSAPMTGEEMYQQLESFISIIKDEDYKKIVSVIYEKHKEKLMISAAALHMHHMVRGGLLFHIVTMAKACLRMCKVYTWLDADLLLAGVLLHDIGKVSELKTNATGMAEDFTKEGKLLGHLELGLIEVHDVCIQLKISDEKRLCLEHLIASHHGEPEFGAATIPVMAEAHMLHFLDLIDSKMDAYKTALDGTNPGEFSEKVYALKNRNIYRHNF